MKLTLLYDGDCPLCRREIKFMQRKDTKGNLIFEDIAAKNFDAAKYGLDLATVNAQIHAVTADGRIVTGMEVFRLAYASLGMGWLTAPTGWPIAKPVFDRAYLWFARNRLRLTFRSHKALDCNCGPRAT